MMWTKPVQKRILNLLSDRNTFLVVLIGGFILIVSFLSFGEAWMQWSQDKYAAIFNSFSDNLAGKSMQSRLCQHVPIDVVYTWVNGSDPLFQDGLKHVKEKLQAQADKMHYVKAVKCPLENCVPSHYFSTDGLLPIQTKLDMIREQNAFLAKEVIEVKDQHLICDTGRQEHHDENRTFLVMESVEAAAKVAATNLTNISLGMDQFHIHQAHWTTEWSMPNAFPIADHFILTKLPVRATPEKILHLLPELLSEHVGRVFPYPDRHLAVVQILDPVLLKTYLKDHKSIELENGASVLVFPAYLSVALPDRTDDEAYAMNRFTDREELRYSLRSLEKYAPWVRHVYLVTNGQVPHWLNLENPRLTIVTHEEIFETSAHLPTFSSSAIEVNLHRIPGLSEKFLYLNDDVFLGEEVWPNDFYDAASGQKVYFSWPLPDCAPGCSNSWIKDGFCDLVCNTTRCMNDGGDCIGKQIKMGYAFNDDLPQVQDADREMPCSEGCLDPWIADGFCDEGCNVAECAYDAGDCGIVKYSRLHQEPPFNLTEVKAAIDFRYTLPEGVNVAVWNLAEALEALSDISLVPNSDHSIRSMTLSPQTHHFVLMLRNASRTTLNVTLQGRLQNEAVMIHLIISCNTYGHVPIIESEEDYDLYALNSIEKVRGSDLDLDLSQVDEKRLNVSTDTIYSLDILEDQLRNEEITSKGFNIKKTALLQPYIRKYLRSGGRLEDVLQRQQDFVTMRKLKDVYGESMLHVNQILTRNYGFANRLAVAHMPHLIDKSIFSALKSKFHEEWEATSGHKIRQSDDMQFAFAYFHFLINEKERFDIDKVFRLYDTDNTGTWSDREIRTLLTRIHNLPLSLDHINNFERMIMSCFESLPTEEPPMTQISNAYERYYDSKLPLVTNYIITQCTPMVAFLNSSLGDTYLYPHKIMEEGEKYSAFRRITSNISQVVSVLDDLRKHPRKFLCLNDNTDHQEAHANNMVHAVLVDYLESVYPVPSSFELPPEYRNKFLHTYQMATWQYYRWALSAITYFCILLLLVLVISSYFKIDIDAKIWAIFQRERNTKECSTV